MNRTCIFGILIVLAASAPSPAVTQVTFSESFSAATLDSRLYTTASSSAYSVGQLTPGSTWQMSKQAGTTTGAVEIHTNFKVSGNFTADLTVNSSNLGTGDFGMHIGEDFWTYPITEMFFQGPQGPNSGISTGYESSGGYGVAGFGVSTQPATLRVVRTGNQFKYFANGHLWSTFITSNFTGPVPVTIFLRPFSGAGAFDPTIGQPDAHAGVLDQFTLTADAFVPEPSSLTLMLCGSAFGWMTRRSRRACRRIAT